MSSFTLYLITRIDYISGLFLAMSIILGISVSSYIICKAISIYTGDYEENSKEEAAKNTRNNAMRYIRIFAVFVMAYCLTPNMKEIAFIYIAPKVVSNEDAQKIPGNVVKLLNVKMEEYISESLNKKDNK